MCAWTYQPLFFFLFFFYPAYNTDVVLQRENPIAPTNQNGKGFGKENRSHFVAVLIIKHGHDARFRHINQHGMIHIRGYFPQ